MKFKAPKGTFDILPGKYLEENSWKSSELWYEVEAIAAKVARRFGFEQIRTPLFESTELFSRSSGETSDIVTKEMYTFEDKGGRSMTLRPEGTAPVLRAAIEGGVVQKSGIQKLFYLSPMFRYERPQAGRYRQHHQFGVEALGSAGPEVDAQVMDLLLQFYKELNISGLKLKINSLGDSESRQNFRTKLVAYLEGRKEGLSEDSINRLKENPMRILDSKDPGDKEILKEAPSLLGSLTEASKERFNKVCQYLAASSLSYEIDPFLVRGLDYYNHTVFEVACEHLGAQNSIGGGGRYDGLIHTLGGPDLPGFGFGCGLERVMQAMIASKSQALFRPASPEIFFLPLDEKSSFACMNLCHQLRSTGFFCELGDWNTKLKKGLQKAYDANSKTIAVVGSDELEKGSFELIKTATKEKEPTPLSAEHLINLFETGVS